MQSQMKNVDERRRSDALGPAPRSPSGRPRILVLTSRLPFPAIGGDRLRILAICRALSEHADITLLSFCETDEEMHLEVPRCIFARCERILLRPWQSRAQVLRALPGRKPLQVAYYENREFASWVRALAPEHDLVLAHLIRTAPYLKHVRGPSILEMTDALSMMYDRAARQPLTLSAKSLVYRLERKRVLRYEATAARRADLASLISPVDAAWLAKQGVPPERLIVAGNGVDLSRRRISRAADPSEVVFVGHMSTLQNQNAVLYYVREVMPLVRRRRRLGLRLIGPCPDDFARELRTHPDVVVNGVVDQLSDAMGQAACGICFMQIAGGVQNKILDYMSVGLPAVVNGMALEGLAAVPGRDLECFDRPEQQAEAIVELATNPERWGRISENGHAYVTSHHGWDEMLAPLVGKALDLARAR